MNRLFFCYSERFKKALLANGFVPLCTGLNVLTFKRFWLFDGTQELNDYKNYKYQLERDKF